MKRLVASIIALILLFAYAPFATATEYDFDSMTLEEVKNLEKAAEDYYEEMTKVTSSAKNEIEQLIATEISEYANGTVSNPLFGYSIKRERDVYTLNDTVKVKDTDKKTAKYKVEAEFLYNGSMAFTKLVVDGKTLIDAENVPAPAIESALAPTAEPLVIYLKYPELGEYGRYYVFNLSVKKATKEDMNTVIQCFIPAGTYIVTNMGKYPTFVYGYSEETHISSAGWEEPVDSWVSGMLKVGASCEITVEEGYYIKLQTNDYFKLERTNTK